MILTMLSILMFMPLEQGTTIIHIKTLMTIPYIQSQMIIIETILNAKHRVTDANSPYQSPQNDDIELNNSCILPSELTCNLYNIPKTKPSEEWMRQDRLTTYTAQDEIERHRYPNIPEHEFLNIHDSTHCHQDAEMRSAPQQEHAQVHSTLVPDSLLQIQTSNIADQIIRSLASFLQMQALKPMQVCPQNDFTPSIFNQNSTIEQQPISLRFGRSLPPGGPRLIKMITDEEIDGLRKLKTKEDRRKRTENPDPEHKKCVRKAGSKAHHERNFSEINELNSMKQRLEESIKIKESSRVKGVDLYNEIQKKAVLKMNWTINTLNDLRYNIPSQFDSTLEEWTNRSINKMNYFISNNTRLFIHNYLLSDERDTNSQIELESEKGLINDLEDIEEGLKQLKMEKKKIEEQVYKLEVDKLYSRKHRKNKALERIRLRNENKRLKSKDDKIGKDLIEIEECCRSLSIDADNVFRDGIYCICRWAEQYRLINRPLPQDTISNFILAESTNFFSEFQSNSHDKLQDLQISCQ
ncbi:hypothetical protein WR25_17006 isoform B [Diploscapter pachys]|uniref:BZIP domain-containing protein n=1 Tax=Diploscapter pachys TaxID=2018661 RepID=A0A2A2L050_9BILA|nr:hypothetical protein WR25_17006 isoform B [Diploscapter pachys]